MVACTDDRLGHRYSTVEQILAKLYPAVIPEIAVDNVLVADGQTVLLYLVKENSQS